MNEFHIVVTMAFKSEPHGTDDQFEAFLDQVGVEMEKIGRDSGLAASLAKREADFAALIVSSSFENAASAFLSDIRTALQAAGCYTPEWPKFTATERVVREMQDA